MIAALHLVPALIASDAHALGNVASVIGSNPVTHALGQIFEPLVKLLRGVLRGIYSVVHNWGVSIILLTVIVRLILMPLTFKQFRSTQAMQALQPKIKELQRKYKGDKRKLQEETMKLYQEYRINPFASCLPMLLQLPIFICLYWAIRGTQELKLAGFLWIPTGKIVSLHPEKTIYGLGNPDPYYILFVLYIVTQMISTELMLTPETDRQQKIIMRLMPLFFVFILFKFPSGLFVYWVTTNLWTIGQQLIIRRTTPHPEVLLAKQTAKAAKPGLMQRLADAQQQAQERTAKGGAKGGDAAGGAAPKPKPKPKPRPGGTRPQRKSGGSTQSKRPPRPSGASDGPKRTST